MRWGGGREEVRVNVEGEGEERMRTVICYAAAIHVKVRCCYVQRVRKVISRPVHCSHCMCACCRTRFQCTKVDQC